MCLLKKLSSRSAGPLKAKTRLISDDGSGSSLEPRFRFQNFNTAAGIMVAPKYLDGDFTSYIYKYIGKSKCNIETHQHSLHTLNVWYVIYIEYTRVKHVNAITIFFNRTTGYRLEPVPVKEAQNHGSGSGFGTGRKTEADRTRSLAFTFFVWRSQN